jgi:3-oxoacyl-[acyl-carrier-protein] synthase II
MARKAVITGLGLITPGGTTLPEVWATLLCGQSVAKPIDTFDASLYPVARAGLVKNQEIFQPFSSRLLKRMDRFCCLAMAATQRALEDSGVDLEQIDRQTAGVYLGNMYGGWSMTDPNLRRLLQDGYREVSPYVASAWFPTAPQGQITINWDLRGYSKTIGADTASSALAIGYAARAIEEGRASLMLAGGAEAPITPYTYGFCARSGRLDFSHYAIFDPERSGFLVGEGAVILVLEEKEAALQRGVRIYAEIAGWATGFMPYPNSLNHDERGCFARLITRALDEAALQPDEIDYIGLDAQGVLAADYVEARALTQALGTASRHPLVTTSKPALTHLLGAGAAAEIATAVLAMQNSVVPPVTACPAPELADTLSLVVEEPRPAQVRHALVNARGADGVLSTLVLKAA